MPATVVGTGLTTCPTCSAPVEAGDTSCLVCGTDLTRQAGQARGGAGGGMVPPKPQQAGGAGGAPFGGPADARPYGATEAVGAIQGGGGSPFGGMAAPSMDQQDNRGAVALCPTHGEMDPTWTRCPQCIREGRDGRLVLPGSTPPQAQPAVQDARLTPQGVPAWQVDQRPDAGQMPPVQDAPPWMNQAAPPPPAPPMREYEPPPVAQAPVAPPPQPVPQTPPPYNEPAPAMREMRPPPEPPRPAPPEPPISTAPQQRSAPPVPEGDRPMSSVGQTFVIRRRPRSLAFLIEKEGEQVGRVFQLEQDVTDIGRDPRNHVVVSDVLVSGFHARVERSPDGGFVITDRGSTNGSRLNGDALTTPQMLRENDEVGLGNTTLVLKVVM